MKSTVFTPVVLGLAICLASCEAGGSAASQAPVSEAAISASKPAPAQPTKKARRTTSSKIALGNLSGKISALQERVKRMPDDMDARVTLVGLLLSRTQFLGSYNDFDTAFQLANDAIASKVAPARAAILNATILSAVHRFEAASKELDRAETLGSKDTMLLRETIALSTGVNPAAIAERRAGVVSERPTYASLTKHAASLTKLKKYEEADAAYQEALDGYRDVSPFPFAWIAFQRGVIWGEKADDADRAFEQYKISVARLPEYIVGNVHLSELEMERGETEAAIARLRRIVDTTLDPEPASRLAQYLADSDPEQAERYRALAHAGYSKLLDRYPLAFSDHATEFYLGAGDDAERALELATLNLNNRKTPRAYRLAIEAAEAAERPSMVCELSATAGLQAPTGC